MALGSTVSFEQVVAARHIGQQVRPVQIATGWLSFVDAGGVDAADNSGSRIVNPAAQITLSTRKIVQVRGSGTILRLRMGYSNGASAITTPPVVQVFGRRDATDAWQMLNNKAGSESVTLTADPATDITDGTLKYTRPQLETHSWDLDGCDELLVGIMTALAGQTGGSVDDAIVQGKII